MTSKKYYKLQNGLIHPLTAKNDMYESANKLLETTEPVNIDVGGVSNCTTCKFTDAKYTKHKCGNCSRAYSEWGQR